MVDVPRYTEWSVYLDAQQACTKEENFNRMFLEEHRTLAVKILSHILWQYEHSSKQ